MPNMEMDLEVNIHLSMRCNRATQIIYTSMCCNIAIRQSTDRKLIINASIRIHYMEEDPIISL